MSAVLIYGTGPNTIDIPITIVENMSEAIVWVENNLKKSGYSGLPCCINSKQSYWNLDKLSEEEKKDVLVPYFYLGYYGGCGECCNITAEVINYGSINFCFSLD